ncbi:MAG: cobyric acid synthase [bacterium]
MTSQPLMVVGTGSGVGKSSLVAGIGRLLQRRGYDLAPFKAQNMSNNSHIAREGGEMAVSQFMQARSCRTQPSVHMNPILLKPNGDGESEVVVQGTPRGVMEWEDYRDRFLEMRGYVRESYDHIAEDHDLVLLEGAGSPAEPNMMDHDLVNLSLAEELDARVILVGDISRGGVFAWLVGTLELLEPSQRDLIEGIVINKFRGDKSVLHDAMRDVERRLNVPFLGVLPWSDHAQLPAEDSQDLTGLESRSRSNDPLDVCMLKFPHLSNFTDFEPLANHPSVSFNIVGPADRPLNPDLIILPGTKNTLRDLRWLKKCELFDWLNQQRANGSHILGVCGGYQMMGREIRDPDALESDFGSREGLGWFDFRVEYREPKLTRSISGTLNDFDTSFEGYEVRYGRFVDGEADPWISGSGEILGRKRDKILGTSIHGLLRNDEVLQKFLARITGSGSAPEYSNSSAGSVSIYDKWSDVVADNLAVEQLVEIVEGSAVSASVVESP